LIICLIAYVQCLILAINLKFVLGMRRFLVDTRNVLGGSHETGRNSNLEQPHEDEVPNPDHQQPQTVPNRSNVTSEFDPNEILCDLALRKQIYEYAPQIQDQVRRAYILKGPTQPANLIFPRTQFGIGDSRSFVISWYKRYNWLEYSESRDAGFFFYCFLVKQPGRAEHFVLKNAMILKIKDKVYQVS
jgi:hypothetical protein